MSTRPIVLTVSGTGCGAHPAAWRSTVAPTVPSLRWYQSIAALTELGGLDALLFDDPVFRATAPGLTGAFVIDSLPLLAALAAGTKRIGLAATVPTEASEPFNIARSFAGLDRLTAGRSMWIAPVTGAAQRPADFAHNEARDDAARYARAMECIEVVRKLWDSWEDEAVLLDKGTGLFNDPARIHPINHRGRFFSVRGPLNAPRPLQGHPPLVQDDASPAGLALARETADLFIARTPTPERYRDGIGSRPKLLATIVPVLGATQSEAEARADALDGLVTGPLARALCGTEQPDAAQIRQSWTSGAIPLVGTADLVAERMALLVDAGSCDGFHIVPAVLPTDLEAFVEQVVPRLRARGLRPAAPAAGTLRETLGLARPRSQFAA